MRSTTEDSNTSTPDFQAAADLGFKLYCGDDTRLDIHAKGAGNVRVILICVERPESAIRIAELIRV